MYGWTALPWIGPGRTSATWTVRSSRFSGRRAQEALHLGAALDLEEADGVGVLDLARRPRDRRAGSARGRSARCGGARSASTDSSTAESIPSPSRSILRKPASEHESLSHWQIWRPAIAAGCTGTRSISGRVEITIPPGCWERWRGRPAISWVSSRKACQRGPVWLPGTFSSSSATPVACQPSVTRASRSSSANGSPSALPTSRIAPRLR